MMMTLVLLTRGVYIRNWCISERPVRRICLTLYCKAWSDRPTLYQLFSIVICCFIFFILLRSYPFKNFYRCSRVPSINSCWPLGISRWVRLFQFLHSLCGRVTGPYGPTVMFTLQSDYAVTLKIYLPELYTRCVDDADIDDINLGRKKWKLKYLGPSDGLAYYVLSLEF